MLPPEPDLTPSEMLRRAEAMRPVLRERQVVCEEMGRLPDDTNQEFLNAGFYRILQKPLGPASRRGRKPIPGRRGFGNRPTSIPAVSHARKQAILGP